MLLPAAVGEPVGEVFGEPGVAQEQPRLPAGDLPDLLGGTGVARAGEPLGEDGLEAGLLGEAAHGVAIDEFGVAEDRGGGVEALLHLFAVEGDLGGELLGRMERREGVVGGLANEFHVPGGQEAAEGFEGLRGVLAHQPQGRAGDGQAEAENLPSWRRTRSERT